MKKILALLLVLILAVTTFAACGKDDKKADKDSEPTTSATTQADATSDPTTKPEGNKGNSSNDEVNSKYEEIFMNSGIVHFVPFFGLETVSFACKDENGIITCEDFGVKGDVVKEEIATAYIPISDLTEEEKLEMKELIEESLVEYSSIACVSTEVKINNNYLVTVIKSKDLDKPENYSELYQAGIIDQDAPISVALQEQSLLEEGYIKK